MEVMAFESALKFDRCAFRHILEYGLNEIYFRNSNGEIEILNFKEWIIRECFGKCTSEFEEQTVMEILKEEFEDFLKGQMAE